MLLLTRKPGQSLTIHPQPSLDPATPVHRLFSEGPIRVRIAGVSGPQVRVGIEAHPGLCILRDELAPHAAGPLPAGASQTLAAKLKVLMLLHRHSAASLAARAGLPVERVVAAQGGSGVIDLDDLERLARALKVRVVELFRPVGETPEERIVLALLEGIQGDT